MRFDNGMLGVCISVCAVMGMVLSGFVLSVGEYEQTVTGYEYVTDVSGLFEYSDQPTFLDYNPAANWSGFYTDTPGVTDGIDYESRTEPANSYPIGQEDIPPDNGEGIHGLRWVTPQELAQQIADGTITDGVTLGAYLQYLCRKGLA